MVPPAGTANVRDLTPDAAGYQIDDLIVDLAQRRVRRAGAVIRLQALSYDLLVVLVRAAPNVVSFDQLNERVWPGLVITPETIVQRVKLLRSALGDDPREPRYIEGVRGRGYRLLAEVRPLTEKHATSESIVPTSFKTTDDESPNGHAGIATTQELALGFATATAPAPSRPAGWRRLGRFVGTVITVGLLATSWVIVHYRGVGKATERTSVAVSPVVHSLVVLPLENLSGDQEQEYFADGMTDALTTELAQVGSLRIISRTSAMHFKGSKETLPQISRDLQIDVAVEGTVARAENRVRVTAQLVEANSDRHLWAKSYERDLTNVLALQDEIAQDITEQIRIKLTPRERSLLTQVRPVDPEAYDAVLRGWYWLDRFTAEGAQKGHDYFQIAIAKDPNYALADAGLADSLFHLAILGVLPNKEAFLNAKESAAKALALNPSLAQAHTVLGKIKFGGDWDWSGAEGEFTQAMALEPNNANAHFWYSNYLVAMDRLDEALKESERAQDLDPFSFDTTWWRGQVLYHARRYDEALRQDRRGLEMYADNPNFYTAMADVYEQMKMPAEAFAARQQAFSLSKDPNVAALGEAYKRSGYSGYLSKQAQLYQAYNPPYAAHLYALLNDEPRAMNALEKSYDERLGCMLFLRTAPELDSIRSSPHFRDLVRRVGYPGSRGDKN